MRSTRWDRRLTVTVTLADGRTVQPVELYFRRRKMTLIKHAWPRLPNALDVGNITVEEHRP